IGWPRNGCSPLSTPPMREPWPPARTMPVTSERMERRPRGTLLHERIDVRQAIDRRHEEREGQVRLARPAFARGLEREARAAAAAEAPHGSRRGFVVPHLAFAARIAHLGILEANPRDDARGVRSPATVAIAVRDESRRKPRRDL